MYLHIVLEPGENFLMPADRVVFVEDPMILIGEVEETGWGAKTLESVEGSKALGLGDTEVDTAVDVEHRGLKSAIINVEGRRPDTTSTSGLVVGIAVIDGGILPRRLVVLGLIEIDFIGFLEEGIKVEETVVAHDGLVTFGHGVHPLHHILL